MFNYNFFMQFNIPITIKIVYEADAKEAPFVAYIPEFDLSSCGKTEIEAEKNVRGVLKITIEQVKKKNVLKEFLQDAGYTDINKSMIPKIINDQLSLSI